MTRWYWRRSSWRPMASKSIRTEGLFAPHRLMVFETMETIMRISIISLFLGLAACSSGNVHTSADYKAPSPPPIRQPFYDPFAAYGSAPATWAPPVFDRHGTIVR